MIENPHLVIILNLTMPTHAPLSTPPISPEACHPLTDEHPHTRKYTSAPQEIWFGLGYCIALDP